MKQFSKQEPIKAWSTQWMIDNQLHPPLVANVDFSKTYAEKQELKLEKLHHKLAKKNPDYQTNQDYLLAAIAKSNVNMNIIISKL